MIVVTVAVVALAERIARVGEHAVASQQAEAVARFERIERPPDAQPPHMAVAGVRPVQIVLPARAVDGRIAPLDHLRVAVDVAFHAEYQRLAAAEEVLVREAEGAVVLAAAAAEARAHLQRPDIVRDDLDVDQAVVDPRGAHARFAQEPQAAQVALGLLQHAGGIRIAAGEQQVARGSPTHACAGAACWPARYRALFSRGSSRSKICSVRMEISPMRAPAAFSVASSGRRTAQPRRPRSWRARRRRQAAAQETDSLHSFPLSEHADPVRAISASRQPRLTFHLLRYGPLRHRSAMKPPIPPPARAHAPVLRRAYFDCRFGQLHVHQAIPPGGGFDERTTLLCVPAPLTSAAAFQPLLGPFGRDRSVFAIDAPGAGQSDPADTDDDARPSPRPCWISCRTCASAGHMCSRTAPPPRPWRRCWPGRRAHHAYRAVAARRCRRQLEWQWRVAVRTDADPRGTGLRPRRSRRRSGCGCGNSSTPQRSDRRQAGQHILVLSAPGGSANPIRLQWT